MPKLFRSEYFPISILLLVALTTGLLTFRAYGESFDESEIFWYGEYSLKAYPKVLRGHTVQDFELPNLNHYGPAYFMLASLVNSAENELFHIQTTAQTWHLVDFLTFLSGSLALYGLARRWLRQPAALATMVLYLTQPLLWGHAFINPKDTPFAAFFLISVVSGLWMCDKIFSLEKKAPSSSSVSILSNPALQKWNNFLRSKTGRNLAIVWLFFALGLWIFGKGLDQGLAVLVGRLYSAAPDSFWGYWFAKIAPHADQIPVGSYLSKATGLFFYLKTVFTLLGAGLILWEFYLASPAPGWASKSFLRFSSGFSSTLLTYWPILIAGILLGLTTSIRVLGPLAGVIVAASATVKFGRKALIPLLTYASLALAIMFLTWPYLWNAPLTRLLETLATMSAYPWEGQVLFLGTNYPPLGLPWSYLPVLLSIQLTEPSVILFWLGCALGLWKLRQRLPADFLILISLWLVLPLLGIILTHRPLYDNFRQLLFLLPPIFLVCGIALEFIFEYLRRPVWATILILALAAPGVYNLYALHPYQYIYYNAAVGGTQNAFNRFEMDYWLTSYQEAGDFLNRTARPGATILAPLGYHLLHLRPDLILKPALLPGAEAYDYVVLSSRSGGLETFPNDQTVLTIERNGAILTVVKQAVTNPNNK
jgi:hypothetical protein